MSVPGSVRSMMSVSREKRLRMRPCGSGGGASTAAAAPVGSAPAGSAPVGIAPAGLAPVGSAPAAEAAPLDAAPKSFRPALRPPPQQHHHHSRTRPRAIPSPPPSHLCHPATTAPPQRRARPRPATAPARPRPPLRVGVQEALRGRKCTSRQARRTSQLFYPAWLPSTQRCPPPPHTQRPTESGAHPPIIHAPSSHKTSHEIARDDCALDDPHPHTHLRVGVKEGLWEAQQVAQQAVVEVDRGGNAHKHELERAGEREHAVKDAQRQVHAHVEPAWSHTEVKAVLQEGGRKREGKGGTDAGQVKHAQRQVHAQVEPAWRRPEGEAAQGAAPTRRGGRGGASVCVVCVCLPYARCYAFGAMRSSLVMCKSIRRSCKTGWMDGWMDGWMN
eukprot:364388-Chlamydomonas_euryale.AAC.17